MRPVLLRPPDFFSGSINDFSGRVLVISSKPATDIQRVPGVLGLSFRMAIRIRSSSPSDVLEELDLVARLQPHDSLLPGGCAPREPSLAGHLGLRLPLHPDSAN